MIGRRLFTLGAAGLALGGCEDRLPSSAVYALVDVSGSYFRERARHGGADAARHDGGTEGA